MYDTRYLWDYVKSIFCEMKSEDVECFFRLNPKNVRFAALL